MSRQIWMLKGKQKKCVATETVRIFALKALPGKILYRMH